MTVEEQNIKVSVTLLMLGSLAVNSDLVTFFLLFFFLKASRANCIAKRQKKAVLYGAKHSVTLMTGFHGI